MAHGLQNCLINLYALKNLDLLFDCFIDFIVFHPIPIHHHLFEWNIFKLFQPSQANQIKLPTLKLSISPKADWQQVYRVRNRCSTVEISYQPMFPHV